MFAASDIHRGETVATYSGKLMTRKDALSTRNRSHLCTLRNGSGLVIDGKRFYKRQSFKINAGIMSMTNHSSNKLANAKRVDRHTGEWVTNGSNGLSCLGSVCLVASREIKKGEEITFDYGKGYWKNGGKW